MPFAKVKKQGKCERESDGGGGQKKPPVFHLEPMAFKTHERPCGQQGHKKVHVEGGTHICFKQLKDGRPRAGRAVGAVIFEYKVVGKEQAEKSQEKIEILFHRRKL